MMLNNVIIRLLVHLKLYNRPNVVISLWFILSFFINTISIHTRLSIHNKGANFSHECIIINHQVKYISFHHEH